MKKNSKFVLLICALSFLPNVLTAEKKKAEDVFEKWTKIQHVFENTNISEVKNSLKGESFLPLKSRYVSTLNFLQTFSNFFDLMPAEQLENGFLKLSVPDDKLLKQRFENLYDMLQGDGSKFVDYLKKIYLTTKDSGGNEVKVSDGSFIEECKDLMISLFASQEFFDIERNLFNVGNKFFEYCFNIKTWTNFKSMLLDETQHVIAKFLYSVMWWNLAGNGWKHWSAQTLKYLKQKADDGCEVIYIAGGSDIYQLIKHGIYNIKIIDPLLPSQPKYYSEGWDWLIRGTENDGVGDEIEFDLVDKKIIMRRESFKPCQKFQARIATGQMIDIERSETVWGIYDALRQSSGQASKILADGKKTSSVRPEERSVSKGKKLGSFKIERRFVNQNDFTNDKKKAMLISFNELYFIAAPPAKGGWGINPHKFADNMFINVKQLHKPVSAKVVRNMRSAFEQMEFNYIALGTCVD